MREMKLEQRVQWQTRAAETILLIEDARLINVNFAREHNISYSQLVTASAGGSCMCSFCIDRSAREAFLPLFFSFLVLVGFSLVFFHVRVNTDKYNQCMSIKQTEFTTKAHKHD